MRTFTKLYLHISYPYLNVRKRFPKVIIRIFRVRRKFFRVRPCLSCKTHFFSCLKFNNSLFFTGICQTFPSLRWSCSYLDIEPSFNNVSYSSSCSTTPQQPGQVGLKPGLESEQSSRSLSHPSQHDKQNVRNDLGKRSTDQSSQRK